ncbi:hypothetical protein GMST_12990 [Geomonas silvestris]|uniref:Uncharacterized protein n=1 Tax=Geomonas silvestris TaxID=2740184 RepID=A0A6V8MGD7_9BACT|nr:hypothetical protein [Geomonas silvestris]GFO58974.1 hypothetical protein GMST_12990 [Geomonas silvestris]
MKQVLLISDTPRVQQVFESLEAQGILQLTTAVTLNQADLEIAAAPPQVAFVQGRISGLSRDIVVRHLKKVLPKDASIVLLAGTLEEMEQAFQHQEPYLDLALEDEALAVLARQVLEGSYQLQRPVAPSPPAAPEPLEAEPAVAGPAEAVPGPEAQLPETIQPPPEAVQAEPETPRATAAEAQAAAEVPPAEQTPATEPEPLLQTQFVPQFEPFTESQPVQLSGQSAEKSAQLASFAALMDEAQKGTGAPEGGLNIEERIVLGAHHKKAADAATAEAKHPRREPGTGEFLAGEPLADALRRAKKKKRPLWIPVALVLALICVPLFSYLAGKKVAPTESALAPLSSDRPGKEKKKSVPAPAPAPKVAEAPAVKPEPAPAPAPKPQPAAPAPAVKTPLAPELKPQPAAAPPAAPAAAGQKALPTLLGQTKLDPEYAKSHPGWQRYQGTSAEYKVFKEGERYKALQVLTLHGETLPEQLLTRALREFGGTEKYRLGTAGAKGKYLVQQGDAGGGVAITVYRNKSDRSLKAFVIYYR